MERNLTNKFLDAIYELAGKPIPEQAEEQVRLSVLDYLACVNLGETMLREENEAFLSNFQESGRTTLIGSGKKITMHNAALLNGMNAHAAELDDGHRFGMIHLGAPVITAMFALAENTNLDAAHFVKGIVVGYEAAIRLASAVQPGHKLRGYHTTGTCGAIGAAIGMAAAMDDTREQFATVLSAAATDAAGILQVIDEGSKLKPYNAGRAAVAAMNAAFMGRTALNGPRDVLGGARGFFKVMADEIKTPYLTEGFGGQYAIELIYRKPYAACRHCHAAIEAALHLRRPDKAFLDAVKKIEVVTYGLAVKGHDHTKVQGASSAKMSIPYSVAAALVYGEAGFQQFEGECLDNPLLQELMDKMEVSEDPELSKLVPQKRVAIVKVTTETEVLEQRVDFPKGEPENPITREELESKYFSLMKAAGKNEEISKRIVKHIWNLETEFPELLAEL